jgi:hypothetical protein
MIEVYGNMWTMLADFHLACVTTNGSYGADGRALMGGGCAREAVERYPNCNLDLGEDLALRGPRVVEIAWDAEAATGILAFPTMRQIGLPAELEVVRQSARQLKAFVDRERPETRVLLPRPGVGIGGLDWSDVRPILLEELHDNRFTIVTFAAVPA